MLGVFVAGRYSVTLASADLGITKEGWKLTFDVKQQEINRSDLYGDALIDMVYRGTNVNLQSDSLEYKAGPLSALTQYQGTLGLQGTTGVFASPSGGIITMTVTTGTQAQLNGSAINTLTATKAIIAPNANIALMFDSTLREFPIRLVLLPDLVGGVVKNFATT